MIAILIFLIVVLIGIGYRTKKQDVSKITDRQKQADELITVILPMINSKK